MRIFFPDGAFEPVSGVWRRLNLWRQHERKRKVETVSLRVMRGIARVGYGDKIKSHEMKAARQERSAGR